jgi:hypothetical protein
MIQGGSNMMPGGSNMAVFSMKWCKKKHGIIFHEMMTVLTTIFLRAMGKEKHLLI